MVGAASHPLRGSWPRARRHERDMRLGQGAREDRPGPAWSQATPEGPLITLSTLLLSGPLSPQHYSLAGALAPSDYSIPRPQQRCGPPGPPQTGSVEQAGTA
ncbi:unnamed protein product [Gadus morhua 'NCC']